jgi:hypothetical protein
MSGIPCGICPSLCRTLLELCSSAPKKRSTVLQHPPPQSKIKKQKHVDTTISNDQPLKSADDLYIRTLKIKLKTYDGSDEIKKTKKIKPCDLNHVSRSWNMLLYLHVHNGRCKQCYATVILDMIFITIFKVKHKLYIVSRKNSGWAPGTVY